MLRLSYSVGSHTTSRVCVSAHFPLSIFCTWWIFSMGGVFALSSIVSTYSIEHTVAYRYRCMHKLSNKTFAFPLDTATMVIL